MAGVDAGLVLLPRFTTLVGATSFVTAPLDLSQQGGAQFQVWRGPIRVASGSGTLTMYMEESLDCQSWALGPLSPPGTVIPENDPKFFSYDLRLRWFRVRFVLAGTDPMVVVWAGGLLRGGGGAAYGSLERATAGEPAGEVPAGPPCQSKGTLQAVIVTVKQGKFAGRSQLLYVEGGLAGWEAGKPGTAFPRPGYDVIDLHGRLWPACGGGPIPVDSSGHPLETVGSSSALSGSVQTPPQHGGPVPPGSPALPVGPSIPRIPDKAAAAGIGAMGVALRDDWWLQGP